MRRRRPYVMVASGLAIVALTLAAVLWSGTSSRGASSPLAAIDQFARALADRDVAALERLAASGYESDDAIRKLVAGERYVPYPTAAVDWRPTATGKSGTAHLHVDEDRGPIEQQIRLVRDGDRWFIVYSLTPSQPK